jgi:hypothetical protein
LFWIWSGVIGPWLKVRVLFVFILFNKMNEDMEIKESAKIQGDLRGIMSPAE